MPIHAVEPRRLYRQIAEQIGALIASGEFAPGKRLPPERHLAQMLGVSRPSVREALIALEIAGLVDVRVGSGIYVRDAASPAPAVTASAAPEVPDPGPFELLRARRLIEGETAALAAKSSKEQDLDAINESIAWMVQENERNAPTQEGDREFHIRIAEASGNSALAVVVRGLWDQRYRPMYTKIEQHFSTPALRAQSLSDHVAIFEAIEKKDARAARAAMHRHLDRVYREFSKSWKHELQDGADA